MRRWIRQSPLSVGVGLVVLGLVLVFFAWNGAAERDFVEGQFPYLLSGGLTGLAVVGVGLAVIVVQSYRRETTTLVQKLDELVDVVRGLGAPAVAAPAAVPDGDLVVAGRSTYHTPDCRIAKGRSDLQVMSPDVAEQRGLNPCRICNPRASEASA